MKFTNEQKELLAFLPKVLKNSKELTDSAKLVLSNIIFLYGMEEAQKNGFVYRTNTKMMEETGIKSEHTLIIAIRHLEILGFIETKRGKRKEASTYKLLKNCSETPKNCSNKCSEIETLQNQVILLQKQMVLLQKEIENLKNCSNKCSTDTDIDEDIEIDKVTIDDVTKVTLQDNNKIKNINIKTSDDETLQVEKVNNDLKLNDMKKENEMSNNVAIAMNDNEQGRSNASESDTINEMTTSTSDDKNKTSKEFQNIPVDKSKVKNNDCNVQGVIPNAKDCAPAPATEEWKPVAWDEDAIFGLKEPQNVSVDKLSTNDDKTRQEAQECPQIEFNREEMLRLMDMSANETDLDSFKEQLRKMDEYMQWLKLNDRFQYKLYVKEIYCWFKSHTWNMEFDFISLGSEFMRKYVA